MLCQIGNVENVFINRIQMNDPFNVKKYFSVLSKHT